MAVVLLAAGLRLVQVGNLPLLLSVLAAGTVGPLLWMGVRRTDGLMLRRGRLRAMPPSLATSYPDGDVAGAGWAGYYEGQSRGGGRGDARSDRALSSLG